MATNPDWPLVVDQIAFTGDPNDPNATPTYTDVTARVRSFETSRGRQYEIDQNQTGEAHLTVSDKDEVLNPANTGAPAPYAGNIKPYRRYLRQAMWPPTPVGAATNLLWGQGIDPSFESYAAGVRPSWVLAVGSGVNPTITTATPHDGTKSVAYSVTAGGGTNGIGWVVTCIPGQQYTASAWVVQSAANTTQIFINGGASGSSTTTTSAYVRLSVTFTASQTTHQVWVCSFSTSLSGTLNIDSIQHEPGGSATTFSTSGPTIYTPFAGYVERWPSSWNHQGTYGLCTLACVDAMATLAGTDLHTEYRAALLAKTPNDYWSLSDGSNATAWAETSGNGGPALTRFDSPVYGAGPTFSSGTATNIPGDPSGTGVTIASTYVVGNQPTTVLQAGATGVGANPFPFGSSGFPFGISFAYWMSWSRFTGGGAGYCFAMFSPFNEFSLQWGGAQGAFHDSLSFELLVNSGGTGVSAIASNVDAYGDGKPHLIVGTITGTSSTATATIYIDGQQVASGPSANTTSWQTPFTFNQLQIGGAISPTNGNTFSSPNNAVFSHFTLWNRTLSAQDVTDLWNAGEGYAGETSGARISRLLSVGGYTGPTAIDTGQSVMDVSTVTEGAALLDACQAVTLSENGNLYVEGGTVTFKARTDRYLKTTATWVFGENQAGGEYPYEADIAYDYDPTRVVNDVTVTRVNGAKANATDATSQKQYFRRSYPRTVGIQSDLEAIDAANYLLGQGKQPIQRVSRLSIKPSANPALWPVALGARIGDRVTVKRRTPAFTMSSDFFIEKIDHANEPGSWVTTFQMSPVGRYQVGIFDDATYGRFDQTLVFGY